MFKKYLGDISQTSAANKDAFEKINFRINEWNNLLDKTNSEIEIIKIMMRRLENIVMGNADGDAEKVDNITEQERLSTVLTEIDDKERQIDFLQSVRSELEEEKLLQRRYIDEMDAQFNQKNQEIEELKMINAKLREDLFRQNQPQDDLAAKINHKKITAMNTVINNLEMEKKEKNHQISDLREVLVSREIEVSELKEKIDNLQAASQISLQERRKEEEEKVKEVNRLKGKIHELEAINEVYEQRIEELDVMANSRAADISELNDKIKAIEEDRLFQQKKMAGYGQELSGKEQKINELNAALLCEQTEKSRMRQKLEKLNEAAALTQQQNSKLEEWNTLYHPLMEKVYCCMALKAFIENNGLGSTVTLETMLSFIKCVGDDYGFAHRVHRAFAIYKKEIQEPITDKEIEVYQEINSYYKKVKKLDFDLFMLPNGLSLSDHFCDGMEFDKNEARDIMAEENADFKTIRCVYVPVLRNKHKEIERKALVKADMHELL